MEAFGDILEKKLTYKNDERDMVIMYHKLRTVNTANNKNDYKQYESNLLVYGDDEYTAMARCVGFPLGVATQLVLNNELNYDDCYGVINGAHEKLAVKVLETCKQFGIVFEEKEYASKYAKL